MPLRCLVAVPPPHTRAALRVHRSHLDWDGVSTAHRRITPCVDAGSYLLFDYRNTPSANPKHTLQNVHG